MAGDGVDTMSAFQANMRALLAQGTCSDVTLQVGGDSGSAVQEVTLIKAHSNVLCAHSPVFALELGSTWRQRVTAAASGIASVADVKVPYSLSATKVALDFCYSGAVEIPAGDVVEVLDLSRHYKISVLADAAAAIIKEQMNATNVCIFYSNAVQFNHGQLSAECAQFCQKNLGEILTEDTFNMLPEVVVKHLVASDDSNAEEIAIFKALVAWGKALYGEECDSTDGPDSQQTMEPEPAAPETPIASPAAHPDVLAARTPSRTRKVSLRDRLAPLLEHVRFPLIDGKALAEHVEPTGLVSDHLLFEAYRYHASGVARDGCPRFVPRKGTKSSVLSVQPGQPAATPSFTSAAPAPVPAAAVVEPQSLWELSLPNGPFELEGKAISANTKEALLDGSYETGVTCAAPGVVVATFPVPTPVSTINVASFHADPTVWGSTNGTGASLEISNDGVKWVPLNITIGGNFGSKADDVLTVPPNLAAKAWRFSHTSFLGLSKLKFNK